RPIAAGFVSRGVSAMGRVDAAEADDGFHPQRVGQVGESIALGIHPAVVEAELGVLARLHFDTADRAARVHQRNIDIERRGTGRDWTDYSVRRQPVEETASAVAHHAAGQETNPLGHQIVVQRGKRTAAHLGVVDKGCAADREVGDLHNEPQRATFNMEMTATGIAVIPQLGQENRTGVGSAWVVCRVKLRAQLSIEGEREYHFAGTYELFRVLNRKRPPESVVGMPYRAELARTGVVSSDVDRSIFTDGERHVRRRRREPDAVRRLQAPGLSAQELPLAALQVQPEQAETVSVRVGGNEDVGGIAAVEVKFDIAGYIIFAKLGMRLEVEPGVLTGGTVLVEVSLHGIAVGN